MNAFVKTTAMMAALLAAAPVFAKPVSAVIKLREKVSMEALAASVQDPASPRYHKFYSPEEIRQMAAPSQEQYQALLSQLQHQGFKIQSESPTHLWVAVVADSSRFETVFSTQLQFQAEGRHQMVKAMNIPQDMSLIDSISGLDSTRKAHPKFVRASGISIKDNGISQSTIKDAYGFSPLYKAGISGKGQHIAVATYDGFTVKNVQYFYQASNLSPGPTVDQVAFNGTAQYNSNSAMETELDAEFTGMIAPGAQIHVFASATNDDAGELQMFTAILDDNRAKVVNYSWGSCETSLNKQHQADMAKVFARAVAQGVNILAASGDSGSDSCQDGTTVADWPAAATNVVAVGGTTFGQNGAQVAETGWNGSGGGISGIWDLPKWQAGLGAPYVKRSYPDISFNADPATGQAIWTGDGTNNGWMVIGGTSMAAPQWSGFLALVGEARATAGKGPLGYLNPSIYSLSDADRAQTFHDVTAGSNGAYTAGPGWDAVTGYGSMQADALLKVLQGI